MPAGGNGGGVVAVHRQNAPGRRGGRGEEGFELTSAKRARHGGAAEAAAAAAGSVGHGRWGWGALCDRASGRRLYRGMQRDGVTSPL